MKTFMIILFCSISLLAQNIKVEKISGSVKYLKGTSEKWENVTTGTILSANDFLETEDNSFIQLNKDGKRFILKSSSALGLNYIKEISVNDLLLALAMEEVRNVPVKQNNTNVGNTAVYGSKVSTKKTDAKLDLLLGEKRLNGAKQLVEFGYSESAVIAAKETYRNYPATKKLIKERIFFTDILISLKLYDEALSELNDIKNYCDLESDQKIISEKIDKVKMELL